MAEHCENCGATDYESLQPGDQGYTACCDELICVGDTGFGLSEFATTPDIGTLERVISEETVWACCGAIADEKAKKLGLEVAHQIWIGA